MKTSISLLTVLIVLAVYACGPEAICYIDGGHPAVNGFGMEWCEQDGDSRPGGINEFHLGW